MWGRQIVILGDVHAYPIKMSRAYPLALKVFHANKKNLPNSSSDFEGVAPPKPHPRPEVIPSLWPSDSKIDINPIIALVLVLVVNSKIIYCRSYNRNIFTIYLLDLMSCMQDKLCLVDNTGFLLWYAWDR